MSGHHRPQAAITPIMAMTRVATPQTIKIGAPEAYSLPVIKAYVLPTMTR